MIYSRNIWPFFCTSDNLVYSRSVQYNHVFLLPMIIHVWWGRYILTIIKFQIFLDYIKNHLQTICQQTGLYSRFLEYSHDNHYNTSINFIFQWIEHMNQIF
jgi:hypothetical protein